MVPECILKLMDFSEEDSDLAQAEFNSKYVGSFVLVNNQSYEFVHNLTNEYLETSRTYYYNYKITSIKAVHPKVGLYTIGENLVYVSKLQKRQYTKSFCVDQTHKITLLQNAPVPYKIEDLLTIGEYHGETVEFNNYLWIRWMPVAEINHELKKIIVLRNAFTPEIEELWNRQLRYSLVFQHPNQNMKQQPHQKENKKLDLKPIQNLDMNLWFDDLVRLKINHPQF